MSGTVQRTCEICGAEFFKKPSDIALGRGRFCSRTCYAKWITAKRSGENSPNWKMIEKQCDGCGKTILVKAWKLNSNKGFYCSQACFFKTHSGESNPRFCRVKIRCGVCNQEFYAKASHQHRRRFCSRGCAAIWKSENMSGVNAPGWMGGISFEPYPPTFNEKFKKLIRERDNYICLLCQEYGKTVHHINYIKDNTTPQNCVTLCHTCNIKANYNRPKWQSLIQSLMENKYGYRYTESCFDLS